MWAIYTRKQTWEFYWFSKYDFSYKITIISATKVNQVNQNIWLCRPHKIALWATGWFAALKYQPLNVCLISSWHCSLCNFFGHGMKICMLRNHWACKHASKWVNNWKLQDCSMSLPLSYSLKNNAYPISTVKVILSLYKVLTNPNTLV